MGKINYKEIYDVNKNDWKALTREPQKYEALLAGHYSDSNHFVYELLQNAEDEDASKVVIEYYEDKLVFYHNGEPFDEKDVRGVSSMLAGTKDKNEAQTIGRFGMGFKSVFKYTYQPEIYSDHEAFRIENYLLPVEIEEGWDYHEAKETIYYEVGEGEKFYPFASVEHLTKIVIPFAKRSNDGDIKAISGKEVLKRLEGLTGEILLFLSTVKSLCWVDKVSGKYAIISLKHDDEDEQMITCRIEGSAYGAKEEISRYLKFKKVFDHPDMRGAEVSIAYRLNSRANNINELPRSDIWVYFPTRDNTNLPFLIHGSFETAVSREKLMTPSAFNAILFDQLGDLISESLVELKERRLITQSFIKKVLIAVFKDEMEHGTIPGLKEKITNMFLEQSLLPTKEGDYKTAKQLAIAVPFEIADFYDKSLFASSFCDLEGFVALNGIKESNFTEYFCWLRDDLKLPIFNLFSWAEGLSKMTSTLIEITGKDMEDLKEFYALLADNRESVHNSKYAYSRGGAYDRAVKTSLSQAWQLLRKAPIVLNAENKLVPAYNNDEPNIYLAASSKYKHVVAGAIVKPEITNEFQRLLDDGLQINAFDNLQYIKEKVIKKYVKINGSIGFENKINYEEEYIEDINQILNLIEEANSCKHIIDLVKSAYIIKIDSTEGKDIFGKPGQVYVDKSDEGIDLRTYYRDIPYDEKNSDEWHDKFNVWHLDTEFYERHGISIDKLKQLGLVTTPVRDGTRRQEGIGDGNWVALGEYCPKIHVDGIEINLGYIELHPEDELAKRKSAEILKLLLTISNKLCGSVRYRKNNPYEKEEESDFLNNIIRNYEWLYDQNEHIGQCIGMSKYDLNTDIYGPIGNNKAAYTRLGFIEKQEDNKVDTFELVDALDKRDKKILLKQLARELGMHVGEVEEDTYEDSLDDKDSGDIFNPNECISIDFPKNRVKNMESLIEHVRQQFFCADPVAYRQVLRQIRVSKSPKMVRAYAMGMYTNEGSTRICQMCKQPSEQVDVIEISNYGIELPQLNLCLCRNCAGRYKIMRDSNKDTFRDQIKQALKGIDIGVEDDKYEIEFNSETSLFFTQTHVAEIQAIFQMIEEHGLPSQAEENETSHVEHVKDYTDLVQKDKLVEQGNTGVLRIKEGSLVCYKKLFNGEQVENVIQAKNFVLHKQMIGKQIGDVVMLQGKQYEIMSIM